LTQAFDEHCRLITAGCRARRRERPFDWSAIVEPRRTYVSWKPHTSSAAMADRDAKKVERQLDRISAGLPSGVGGFLRWLRSPLSRWVRIPAGLLLIIGGVVGFVGVGILDGAAWRPAACAGPPLPPTAGNENVSNGRVRGHVYRGTGIL